jgi:hypothetical protein
MALQFEEEFRISHLQHQFSPTIGHQKRRNKNMSALWTLVHSLAQFLNRRIRRSRRGIPEKVSLFMAIGIPAFRGKYFQLQYTCPASNPI